MAHQGFGGVLDTPQSNFGDATYLNRQPDFADISQEASFLSPEKDGDLLQQLRNGGRSNGINIRTPRQRPALADRRNLPSNIGGGEFTPLLKSATRNSTRRNGKENSTTVAATPAALRKLLEEDEMTPLPRMDGSAYSTRNASFLDNDFPPIASSASTTPMGPPPRRNILDKGPLQDGNQLSLREQENVIDKIEKENFGLKLKIHFLEEALRKAGPGFSEAALKENTELKVDKVTMQRELHKYKKDITTAERELESYRQQMLELREKAEQKYANKDQQAELNTLREAIQARESDIVELRSLASNTQDHQERVETLENNVVDLEAELREKDRELTEREDELDDLREKLNDLRETIQARESDVEELQSQASNNQNHQEMVEQLENNVVDLEAELREKDRELTEREEELNNLRETIQARESDIEELQNQALNSQDHQKRLKTLKNDFVDLEAELREKDRVLSEREDKLKGLEVLQQTASHWEEKAEWMKERMNSALSQKEKAEAALDELQDEMANKSIMTKGLSRQIEERVSRLQEELRKSSEEYTALELEAAQLSQENDELKTTVQEQLSLLEDAAQSQEEVGSLRLDLLEHQRYIEELIASEAALSQKLEQVSREQSLARNTLQGHEEIENLKYEMLQQQELINHLEAAEAARHRELEQQQRLRAENMGSQAEIERLKREIVHLQEEIENITASETALREELDQEQQRQAEYYDVQAEAETLKEKVLEQERFIDDLVASEAALQQQVGQAQQSHIKIAVQSREQRLREEARTLREEMKALKEEAKNLEDEVIQQQELIDDLMSSEAALQEDLKRQQEFRADSDTNTKAEIEALEQDVLQQQELIDEMVASEAILRQELERERRSLERKQQSQAGSSSKQGQRLRESQVEVENLERDINEQQELINNLVASEAVLRSKLERARTERAAYRMSLEKMQSDIQHLKKEAAAGALKLSHRYGYADNEALDTIVRASEGAQVRHKKELRGMMLQMEWMQARWEREVSLRSDAAYAKKFLQLQLNITHACNKAQLRELEHIRTKVLQSRKPLTLPKPPSFSSSGGSSSPKLKTFLIMARFIARTRIAARNWAGQEAVRQKLRTAIEEKRQIKRSKQLKVVAADVY
ncbi:hypothetical protein ACHAO4_008381 [Trichoderma viride]